ncbi:MAG: hypothetical protein GXP48_03795, partial [Acidobacteria bacterium]|nr:hypothetical protein [Acidobacteriota bacterium]
MRNASESGEAAWSWRRSVLLFGLERRWLDGLLTAGLAALLFVSRFALLASGPWEWDETLFANGIYYFSLTAHYPQPPGFPGWIWLGHLLFLLTPTPLEALQIASAFLSVVALWPLAILGRRVAPRAVAVVAAVFVLVLPGPWLHAVRGFSSIPATTFALLAAALLAGGLSRWRATAFTLLVTVSFLIRPILLPGLGLLWLGGAWTVRPKRRLIPGAALALACVGAAIGWMVHAEGGWQPFAAAFVAHGKTQAHNLAHNVGGLLNLGLVKGVGGPLWAGVLGTLAIAGLVAWAAKVGRRGAVLWVAVLGVTALQLVFLQNRTYTRYAVPVHVAMAPLVAGGAALLLPASGAVAGLALAALLAVGESAPLLVVQHAGKLPGWAAVESSFSIARRRGRAVLAEAGLYPFANYLWHVEGSGIVPANPPLLLSSWAPEPFVAPKRPWIVVTDHPGWYLGSLTGEEIRWKGVPDALVPFTQERFLDAAVIDDPALPVGRWWHPETSPGGVRFMWGSAGAGLDLPPLPPGTWVRMDLRPAAGPAPLNIIANGRLVTAIPGRSGRTAVWIPAPFLLGGQVNRITFGRRAVYPPGHGDHRPLGVKLFEVTLVGPGVRWHGPLASLKQRRRLRARLAGAYAPERFPGAGRGCWLRPRAEVGVPAGWGDLAFLVAAPRPTPPRLEITAGGKKLAGPFDLGPRPRWVHVHIPQGMASTGGVRLQLESVAF